MTNTKLMQNYLKGIISCYVDAGTEDSRCYYIDNQNFTDYTRINCSTNNIQMTNYIMNNQDIEDGKIIFEEEYQIEPAPLGLDNDTITSIMNKFTECLNGIYTNEYDNINVYLQIFEDKIYELAGSSTNDITLDEAAEIITTGKRYLLIDQVTQYVYDTYVSNLTSNYSSYTLLKLFNSSSLDNITQTNTLQKIVDSINYYDETRINIGDFVYVNDSIVRYGTVYKIESVKEGSAIHNICTVYLDNGTLKDYSETALTRISIDKLDKNNISTTSYGMEADSLQYQIRTLRMKKAQKTINTSYTWTKDGNYQVSEIDDYGEATGKIIPYFTIVAKDNNSDTIYTNEYYRVGSLEPSTSTAQLKVNSVEVLYSSAGTVSDTIKVYFPVSIYDSNIVIYWTITNSTETKTYISTNSEDAQYISYVLNQDKNIMSINLKSSTEHDAGYSEIVNFIITYEYNPAVGYAIDSSSITLDSSGNVSFKVNPNVFIDVEEVYINKEHTKAYDSAGTLISNPSINIAYYDTIPLGDNTNNYYRYSIFKKIDGNITPVLSLFDIDNIIRCTMSSNRRTALDEYGSEINPDTRYIYHDDIASGEADNYEYLYNNSVLRRFTDIMSTVVNNIWLTGTTLIEHGNNSRAKLDTLYLIDSGISVEIPDVLTQYVWDYSNLDSYIYEKNTEKNNYVRYGLTFGPNATVEEGDTSYEAYIKMATEYNDMTLDPTNTATLPHVYITKDKRHAIALSGRVCRDLHDTSNTEISVATNYPLYSNMYYADAISISDNANVARIWTKPSINGKFGFHFIGKLTSENKIEDSYFTKVMYEGDNPKAFGVIQYNETTGEYYIDDGSGNKPSFFTGKSAELEDGAWFFKVNDKTEFVYYKDATEGAHAIEIFKATSTDVGNAITKLSSAKKYVWDWNAPLSYGNGTTEESSTKFILAQHRTTEDIARQYPTVTAWGNFVEVTGSKKCICVKKEVPDNTDMANIKMVCWSALDTKGNLIEFPDTACIYKHLKDSVTATTQVYLYNPVKKISSTEDASRSGRIECYFQPWNGTTENYTFIEESRDSTNITLVLDEYNVTVTPPTVSSSGSVPLYLPTNYIDSDGDGTYRKYVTMYGEIKDKNCIYTYNEKSNNFVKTDLDNVINTNINTSVFKSYRLESDTSILHPTEEDLPLLDSLILYYSSAVNTYNYYYKYDSGTGQFNRASVIEFETMSEDCTVATYSNGEIVEPTTTDIYLCSMTSIFYTWDGSKYNSRELLEVVPEFLYLGQAGALTSDSLYFNSVYNDSTNKYFVYDDVNSIYREYTRYTSTDSTSENNILIRNANLDTDVFFKAYDATTEKVIIPDSETVYSVVSNTAATLFYYKYKDGMYQRDDSLQSDNPVTVIPDGIVTIRDENGNKFTPVAMNDNKKNIVYIDSVSDGGTGQYFKYYDGEYKQINASEVSQSELTMNVTLTLELKDFNI